MGEYIFDADQSSFEIDLNVYDLPNGVYMMGFDNEVLSAQMIKLLYIN